MEVLKVSPRRYFCFFCGKDDAMVAQIILGPNAVGICNECVALAHKIIHERSESQPPSQESK